MAMTRLCSQMSCNSSLIKISTCLFDCVKNLGGKGSNLPREDKTHCQYTRVGVASVDTKLHLLIDVDGHC